MTFRNGYSYGKVCKDEIKEELRLIDESITDYITQSGRVYKLCFNGKFIEKAVNINKHNGYVYIGLTCKDGKNRSRRLHRLLAKAWIENPNPEMYDVVGHKNNIKSDYSIDNLYWTNTSENTQKAHDDELVVNDAGVEDSQSNPVAFYKNNGELVSVYGSITFAANCIKNFSKSTISKVVDKTIRGRKGYFFRTISAEEYHNSPDNKKELPFEVHYITKVTTPIEVFLFGVSQGVFSSQKDVERKFGIEQARVSSYTKSGKEMPSGHSFARVERQ